MAEDAVPEVVLSEERVEVETEWTICGAVRLRKQIVTSVQTIQVPVRREELVVEFADVLATTTDGLTWAGQNYAGPAVSPPTAQPPLVVVLREEIPEVAVSTRAYERAVVHRVLVSRDVPVTETVGKEHADVDSSERRPQ